MSIDMGPIVNPANGHTYYRLSPSKWTEAEGEAGGLGGHLVTINDAQENDWVFDTFSQHGQYGLWIGLNDAAVEGRYVWSSGETVTFTDWASDQPDNFYNEDYVEFMVEEWGQVTHRSRNWNDFRNDAGEDVIGNTGGVLQGVVEVNTLPSITITDITPSTFITTDTITVHASLSVPLPGVQVMWTVQGHGAASGISGFPTNVVSTTDATGTASFSFTPSDNPNLVNDRHTNWTKGRREENPAITFLVTAMVTSGGQSSEHSRSITQDEVDRLRQEYYDYSISVPARSEVVPSLGVGFNKGNYGVQLSVGLDTRYNAILAAYRGRQITVTIGGQQYTAVIPADARLTISSGYRNPQRNKAVKGVLTSKHIFGRALDIVPPSMAVHVMVNGRLRRVAAPVHGANGLYAALQVAASQPGITAFAEDGPKPVPLGSTQEDHIHAQW